jgi:serine/threonine protein kinase
MRNGAVIFDLAWLVNPYTWTGRIALAIGVPVLTKLFLQSDFYRNISPLTRRYIQKLRTEIESQLPDNLPNLDRHQQLKAFPTLSFEGIANLQENGFIHFKDEFKIPATRLSSEMPASFQITVDATKKTYQIFNTEELGAGICGKAFLGQDLSSGVWVAVKMQPLRDIAKEQDVLIENRHLLADRKLLGHAIYKKNGNQYLMSIMPLFVKDSPRHCSSSEKIDFLIAVAHELKRLHQKNKIHSDLHLGNVCWNKAEGVAQLIDYGSLVNTENPFESTSHYVLKLYTPPESLFGLGLFHVKASDIYALGCMARQLFSNTHNARLNSLISNMQHSLFFKRPSLDIIIRELTAIKDFANDIIEQPIAIFNKEEEQCLNKVYEEIASYKTILQELDVEIAVLKNITESDPDYIHLAMCIKEKSIYQKYLQSLISSQFQNPIQSGNVDELQKDLKKLIALKPDYQPRIPIVESSVLNLLSSTNSHPHVSLDDDFKKPLLMQFNNHDPLNEAFAKNSIEQQQTGEPSKNRVSTKSR